MKYLFVFVCSLLTCFCFSQEYYVPYRINDKFGLASEKGKLVIDAVYDDVIYLKEDYFITRIEVENETKNTWGRTRFKSGLIKGKKVIITDAPQTNFIIYDNLIANTKNPYHAEDCSLYTNKGELLLSNVKALDVNDEREIGHLPSIDPKYDFIELFERNGHGQRTFSLALYDNKVQKIVKWLLKDISKYELVSQRENYIVVRITDNTGVKERYISYVNGTFEVLDSKDPKPAEGFGTGGRGSYDNEAVPYIYGDVNIDRGYGDISIPTPAKTNNYSDEELEKMGLLYYTVKNDSIYYVRDKEQKYIAQADKNLYIFQNDKSSRHKDIILKKNNRHTLLVKGTESSVLYDSLYYFGNNFLAGNKVGNVMKFGILNREGKEILPIAYDSIYGKMLQCEFDYKEEKRSLKFLREERNKYSKSPVNKYVKETSSFIQVHKDSKTGMLTNNMEVIIPMEYDLIAKNEINYVFPRRSEFIILKKNNKYGLTYISYNKVSQKNEMTDAIAPIFTDVPCYYINDYFGITGLKLYGMYTKDASFSGFATEKGKIYYKDTK